jgi:hypothetical protein
MGKVKDLTGAGLSHTLVELRSETAQAGTARTNADFAGEYHFIGLPPGEYTLKLSQVGFRSLNVKSIHISEGEQKSLPTLELTLGYSCGSGSDDVAPDYMRSLLRNRTGDVVGSVIIRGRKNPPATGADVTLLCSTRKVCGATKTNSKGEFAFKELLPGDYSVRISRAGFYTLNEPGYKVTEGLESIYWPIQIERCPLGNCDPRLRPKKPLALCE